MKASAELTSRYIMKIILLALVLTLLGSNLRAQIHSKAFDSLCYEPAIGLPGVVDSVVGDYLGEALGATVFNAGPVPHRSDGTEKLVYWGPGRQVDGATGMDVGPLFKPTSALRTAYPGLFSGRSDRAYPGHYRSKRYTDLLVLDSADQTTIPRIYWADDNGNYDTAMFTTLTGREQPFDGLMDYLIYHTYLTSDSAEDVVLMYIPQRDSAAYQDTVILAHYSGGDALYRVHGVVYPDAEIYFDSTHKGDNHYAIGFYDSVADYRGIGRKDLLAVDSKGNFLFYKNDPPFSLDKLADALHHDTVFTTWSDPRLSVRQQVGSKALAMHALPRATGDPTEDLLVLIDTLPDPQHEPQIRIFPGGPDFGSHRITLDSAAYTIHSPMALDPQVFGGFGWGFSLRNCGDMTGTGNPVLCVEGGDGFDLGFYTFYVLGQALDEKVDMYIAQGNGYSRGALDTATLDPDGLTDFVIGMPSHPDINGESTHGTLLFVHGSREIPVHKNPRFARVASAVSLPSLSATFNEERRSLELISGDLEGLGTVRVFNLLGQTCCTRSVTLEQGYTSVPLPDLPRSAYVVQLSLNGRIAQTKFIY